MRKSIFAAAAAALIPNAAPVASQVPAAFDIETVQPIAGAWSYRSAAGTSESLFVDATAAIRLVVRCNRAARTVSIVRTGVAAAAPTMSIWTTSESRSIPSRFAATGELSADIAARDPLLDSIAFSRGRFATGAAGAPLTAVPVAPEMARVIEDCRV